MTTELLAGLRESGYRRAGRLAIISGVFGIVAFAMLLGSLASRSWDTAPGTYTFLLRSHDAAIIFQSLCLMPLVLALDGLARRHSPGSSPVTAVAGIIFLALVAACVLLGIAEVIADVIYMIPQGAVGGWLIVVGRQTSNEIPRGLRRLGLVAGIGLLLVAVFPIGSSLFVDPAIFHGPVSDDDMAPAGTEKANSLVHLALAIGTFIGCSTYPIWAALTGRWLLLRRRQ
jgi:hypothetical protein